MRQRQQPGSVRRPPLAGPFFLLTLLLGVFLVWRQGGWETLQGREQTPAATATGSPGAMRVTAPGRGEPVADPRGPVPEAGFVLKHARDLDLSSRQLAELEKTRARWEEEAGPLKAQLQKEAERFQRVMDTQVVSDRGQGLGAAMAPVSRLSGRLAELRRRYWQAVLELLTPGQRQRLEALRQGHQGGIPHE